MAPKTSIWLPGVLAIALASLALTSAGCAHGGEPRSAPVAAIRVDQTPPSLRYTGLYDQVAEAGIFPRMKGFADAVPRADPDTILAAYRRENPTSKAELVAFVEHWFVFPPDAVPENRDENHLSLAEYIAARWTRSLADSRSPPPHSSLLPMPGRYITSGGLWREQYYWNTYFLIIGLGDQAADLKKEMIDNIAFMIDRYGYAPTANRSYYLSRSQPPYFYEMVATLAPDDRASAYARYLPQLRKEHAYWMAGADRLKPGEAHRRVVRMPNGVVLNRYWDDRAAPRDEAAVRDRAIAARATRPAPEVYRDIRAGAESGWDFTSRWFGDRRSMETIQTTAIIPIDLNSLLYGLEDAIAQGCARQGDRSCAKAFRRRAETRRAAINTYLWNEKLGLFDDYDWREHSKRGAVTAAALSPLAAGLATADQAARTALRVRSELLAPGGLLNTNLTTGEQWDAPNGFAAVQWIAVQGLRRYGQDELARTIAAGWLTNVSQVYAREGRLAEKYDVVAMRPGGGGGYPLQSGQGWTASVTGALLRIYPEFSQLAEVKPGALGSK